MSEAMIDTTAPICPMHAAEQVSCALEPHEELVFPKNKRVVAQYVVGDAGQRELHLHYRAIEIVFDEPELFAFGETLSKQARFVAESATSWGSGYAWAQIQELLQQLLASGVLRKAAGEPVPSVRESAAAPPLPAAEASHARSWLDCEAITAELTGHALPLGYLEVAVPLYRVAHPALDQEQRQVGEANVFPVALRLDVPTEWRVCQYPGSRFQDEFPMNLTALKSMIKHWKPLMRVVREIRNQYRTRFECRGSHSSVGDMHRLSSLSMGIAGYLMMRAERPVANGQLHPLFSSLVRISDGVRITAHEMLFSPYEGLPLHPQTALTANELYGSAERNDLLLSKYGVCAAPKQLIEEYLAVLFDGVEVKQAGAATPGVEDSALDASVQKALAELNPAFDYCVAALQVYAVVFSTWIYVSRAYQTLLSLLAGAGDCPLRERLRFDWAVMEQNHLGDEAARARRFEVYADLYARCNRASTEFSAAASLGERIAPLPAPAAANIELVRTALQQRFAAHSGDSPNAPALAEVVLAYLQQEQAIVRAASELQARVNLALGRSAPARPLSGDDVVLHHRLRQPTSRLPYLMDALKAQLGLSIRVTSDELVLVTALD